jgi:anti-sigma regulatory factor (Ser/Thr protein kinase)
MEVGLVHRNIEVRDASQVGEARRVAAAMAQSLGLDETACAQVGIVANELANNLLQHATEGVLSLRACAGAGRVELMAVDRGPGMDDVGQCLRDGFSTRGTPGTGLGAVRRLAAEFDIHSARGRGTVVLARVGRPAVAPSRMDWGVACYNAPGESLCGDGWSVDAQAAQVRLLLVDGLGHGPEAHAAAHMAGQAFDRHRNVGAGDLMERLHRDISGTRGGAAAVAISNLDDGRLDFCGIGNISARLVGAASRGLASHNGTVGHQMRRAQPFVYEWRAGDLLVLHSDGIQTRWNLDDDPGLSRRHPAVIAGVLARDYARGHDDRTVLVARRLAA